MCGIAGIIQSAQSLYHSDHLKRMTDAIAHRGPDGEGHWQNNNGTVLLGHRRLSIIDLSTGASQPMHYNDRYTIVYNGEIYNYIELRDQLRKKGYHFKTNSDTEVILAAYDCYKDECPDYLDGMFAFAIWDEQTNELFAARDRFGEKPFFYSLSGGNLLFGSEMKALWAAGTSRRPNLKMLFNFITIGYTDNPSDPAETFFADICKLPAASILTYNPATQKLSVEKYWDIDPAVENKGITDNEAVEKFNSLLKASIEKRFRGDVPIGTSLSGGLDSSTIVACSNEINAANNSHKCFTAVFPGFEKNELEYAKAVADKFSMEHLTITMSADELADSLEKLMYYQEEPFSSASIYAQYKVYEHAKQHNIKSMLDGQGADEILAGYPQYYKWYWQELFRERKLLRSKEIKLAREKGVTEKFGFENIVASLFPEMATVFLEHQYLLHALQQQDLTKEFILSQSKEAYYTTPEIFGLNGALYFSTCMHGLEELLRYADRNSMAHGCEVRLPFLDHQLVEFVFSLPSHFKIKEGWTKWLLRKATENKLPGEIVWRKNKIGFEPPQQEWMQHKKLQQMVQDSKQKLVSEKILKQESLTKPVKPLSAYAADNYDWRYLTAAFYL